MLRTLIFRLHWLLGLSAGLVLAVAGVTGALLSYQHALLDMLNPDVVTVVARGEPLSPAALLARIEAQRPDDRVQAMTRSRDPADAVIVGFAPRAAAEAGGRARGEQQHVDPYDGSLLGQRQGEAFFRTTMQLHRWLLAGEAGKQVVGASTLALLFFAASGLYLRWPRRRWKSLRAWLALDRQRSGRAWLWQLHSVLATWLLPIYLLIALSGLWWSYPAYRSALQAWAGVEAMAHGPASPDSAAAPLVLDIDAAWQQFERSSPDWSSASLRWPGADGLLEIRYLDADPAHERAGNTLVLDARTLAVVEHDRYADRTLPQRIVGSMFAIHRGSFFGSAGPLLWMLASLMMPLFAVTGWMLYLSRRRRAGKAVSPGDAAPVMRAAG